MSHSFLIATPAFFLSSSPILFLLLLLLAFLLSAPPKLPVCSPLPPFLLYALSQTHPRHPDDAAYRPSTKQKANYGFRAKYGLFKPASFNLHIPLKLTFLLFSSTFSIYALSVIFPQTHPVTLPSLLFLSCISDILTPSNFPPSPDFQLISTSIMTSPQFLLLPLLLSFLLLFIFPLRGTVAL